MSDAPSAVCPGPPTRSATLLYTQPMMFMFTVLPYRVQSGVSRLGITEKH